MKRAALSFVAALAVAAGFSATSKATSECHGIKACIRVPGPWVVVPAQGTTLYLLSCPHGQSVVGGLDAQATSRAVSVAFEGRLGAPVQPGQTTTRYALYSAVSTSIRVQAFKPLLGCIPTAQQPGGGQGGGGRSTVSARVTPAGQPLEFRARQVEVGPGDVKSARISCRRQETRVGVWEAIAFRTKRPPNLARVGLVRAHYTLVGQRRVVLIASSTDALSPDAHAIVQVGTKCAS